MVTFALISEGPTDQVVLEAIILEACEGFIGDDVEVNYAQPLRDQTDQSRHRPGGWERVLEYCQHNFADALYTNEYIVVHIDTDAGEEQNFGLSLTQGGKDKNCKDLIDDAINIIVDRIGRNLFEQEGHRILFAISVHSIESWLLLCLFNVDEPKASWARLNRRLIRRNEKPLVKDVRRYLELSRAIKRKSLLSICKKGNTSLGYFVRSLRNLRTE